MEMKINIKKLLEERNKRAWTQAHLAEVCGLSLRTIQRIEKSGVASNESIQALASVFEISVEKLILKQEVLERTKEFAKQHKIDTLFSKLGLVLMLIIPSISLMALLTGSDLRIDLSDADDMSKYVTSSSTIMLLFNETNIAYYTLLPAIAVFCISILKFKNRKPWVKNSLIFSSILFFLSSQIFGLLILLFVISILVFMRINKPKQPLRKSNFF